MLMTEDQARTKWCPHVRSIGPVGSEAQGTSGNRWGTDWTSGYGCIASDCMSWRWADPIYRSTDGQSWSRPLNGDETLIERGFCGLAGLVEF